MNQPEQQFAIEDAVEQAEIDLGVGAANSGPSRDVLFLAELRLIRGLLQKLVDAKT